jgi:quinol monooxygenase YgiN
MKLTLEVLAKQGKYQELYQTLQALLTMIRKEKGCQECRIYRDTEDGEVFFLAVDWEEEANLVQYLRSNSGSALLGAIDLLSETTRVRIGTEEQWEGIETLKKMRREK